CRLSPWFVAPAEGLAVGARPGPPRRRGRGRSSSEAGPRSPGEFPIIARRPTNFKTIFRWSGVHTDPGAHRGRDGGRADVGPLGGRRLDRLQVVQERLDVLLDLGLGEAQL